MIEEYKKSLKSTIKVLLSQDLTDAFNYMAAEILKPSFVISANGSKEHLFSILLLAVDDAKLSKPSSNNPVYLAFYNLAIETLEEIPLNDSSK